MNKNPYEILGVAKNATDADIKKAYHKLVLKYHPDKNAGDKGAEEKFKEVNNAFDILKDPQKRAAYDQFGAAAFGAGNGASAGTGGFGGNPFGNGNFEFHFGGDNINLQEMMDRMFRDIGGGFGPSPFGAEASADDIMEQMRGGRNRGGRAGSARRQSPEFRGRDMLHTVVIDLRDAFFGKTEKIKFTANVKCETCQGFGTADGKSAPVCERCAGTGYVRSRGGIFAMETVCPECHGTGRTIKNPCKSCDGAGIVSKTRELEVKIPAGVTDGARLRLAGQGESGPLGGAAGDFYIDVRIRPDSRFERSGDDLIMRATIPFATLALGGEVDIETIDDKKVGVKIPAGTQVGEQLRVRGLGMRHQVPHNFAMQNLRDDKRGDLYLVIGTEVPKKLSEKQKSALEEFSGAAPKKRRRIF